MAFWAPGFGLTQVRLCDHFWGINQQIGVLSLSDIQINKMTKIEVLFNMKGISGYFRIEKEKSDIWVKLDVFVLILIKIVH